MQCGMLREFRKSFRRARAMWRREQPTGSVSTPLPADEILSYNAVSPDKRPQVHGHEKDAPGPVAGTGMQL